MRIGHVALVSGSEEKANRFFKETLGLKELRSTVIPANLSKSLFGIDRQLKVIDFGNEEMKFEVFIAGGEEDIPSRRLDHVCLEVENRDAMLRKWEGMGFEILRVPKGDSVVVFLKDENQNLFEIKEKK